MTTPFDLAQRFVGELRELKQGDDPFIQFCFTKCGYGPDTPDETAWCSAFVNGICWLLRLARSKSAAARSWLTVGQAVTQHEAVQGYDIVVLRRGDSPVSGHVGFFAGIEGDHVLVLGGNQSDAVTVAPFPISQVLGIRRLRPGV